MNECHATKPIESKALLVLVLLLTALTLWSAVRDIHPRSIFFTNDLATSLGVGDSFLRGESVLAGPPSHRGGRHLGPIYYWYVALVLALSGGDYVVAARLFAFFQALGAMALVGSLTLFLPKKHRSGALIGGLLTLVSCNALSVIREGWHSHTLLLTLPPALVATASIAKRGVRALPWCFLTYSLLLQTHFSSVPILLGLVGCGGWMTAKEWRLHEWRFGIGEWIAILLGVASWVPFSLFLLRYPSTATAIFSSTVGHGSAYASIREIGRTCGEFFLHFTPVGLIEMYTLGRARDFFGAVVVCFFTLGALRLVLKERNWNLLLLLTAPSAVLLVSLKGLHSPLVEYFLLPILFVPIWISALFFASCKDALHEKGGVRIAAIGGLAVFSLLLVSGFFVHYLRPYTFPFHSLLHSEEITKIMKKRAGEEAKFQIFGRTASKFATDAFYLTLGRSFYPSMQEAPNLPEIASFQPVNEALARAFVVMCPAPFSRARRKILEEFSKEWTDPESVDLSTCTTCERCWMGYMERR